MIRFRVVSISTRVSYKFVNIQNYIKLSMNSIQHRGQIAKFQLQPWKILIPLNPNFRFEISIHCSSKEDRSRLRIGRDRDASKVLATRKESKYRRKKKEGRRIKFEDGWWSMEREIRVKRRWKYGSTGCSGRLVYHAVSISVLSARYEYTRHKTRFIAKHSRHNGLSMKEAKGE